MDGSMTRLRDIESRLPPGFRFHPSDEELVCYYLRAKVLACTRSQQSSSLQPIVVFSPAVVTMLVDVDLHVSESWDLPVAAKVGDKQEWYFFSSRDRKYATGSRTNRATPHGYWKETGKDKVIHDTIDHGNGMMTMMVGMRKTLVFYFGRAPNGRKSDWVMHEFRLVTSSTSSATTQTMEGEDWVLCRVFHKGKGEATIHGGSKDLDMLITSSSRLQSPPQPADNLDGGGQLFPIGVSSPSTTINISRQLVGDDHGLIMGQDAMPGDDRAMIRQQAAAGDGFLEFSESTDATVQMDMCYYGENCMREMEMETVLLQPGGNNYFDPCT